MVRKLKVFRTPIGFHDAFVAAPSQKAAFEAWGSDADLFSRGSAELVTDEALTREPLENPGKVIRRIRDTAEEHFAALPKSKPTSRSSRKAESEEEDPNRASSPREARARKPKPAPSSRPKPPPPPKPRPSRDKLNDAERRLEEARAEQDAALAGIREKEKALEQERRALEQRHGSIVKKLETAVESTRERYETAMDKWRQ